MLMCSVVLLAHRLRTGSFKTMHIVTLAVALILGTATLVAARQALHSVEAHGAARAYRRRLSRQHGDRQTAARAAHARKRVQRAAADIPRSRGSCINSLWAGWFALLAAANIYVARNFAESVWVNFKVFGISVAMLLFMIPQVLWLNGKTKPARPDTAPP